MIYDLSIPSELADFDFKVKYLILNKKKVELKAVNKKRTILQNKYLHVCITLFSIEHGYTLDEGKTHLKRSCDFMVYEKNNERFLKRTREMDTLELTKFIEWIRNYSAQNGCYIPSSEEYLEQQFYIDKEIAKHSAYL